MPGRTAPTAAPDLPERVRAWSYRRQLLGQGAPGPADALRDVVGVYSSHPTAPLALLSRCAPFDARRFGELEQRRESLRLPSMRQSIFLLPTDTAGRIFAATRLPLEKPAKRLRYAGLDWDDYARLTPHVLEHARQPITVSALQEALQAAASAMMVLRVMAREGLVVRLGSSLRTDSLRCVATEAWLGQPLKDADPVDSLRWLAEDYLRGYGPARIADFAWWSGASRRSAAAALASASIVDLGDGLLLPADQQAAFERVPPDRPGDRGRAAQVGGLHDGPCARRPAAASGGRASGSRLQPGGRAHRDGRGWAPARAPRRSRGGHVGPSVRGRSPARHSDAVRTCAEPSAPYESAFVEVGWLRGSPRSTSSAPRLRSTAGVAFSAPGLWWD